MKPLTDDQNIDSLSIHFLSINLLTNHLFVAALVKKYLVNILHKSMRFAPGSTSCVQ